MLPVRGSRGYEVYAAGMEASAADKARILRFVCPGVIADLGCGTGTVLELLRRKFRKSQLVGVDLSPEMIERCRKRFPGAELRRHDIVLPLFDDASMDTIILCSIMHEVFSYKGYDYQAVRQTLRHGAEALRPGGWAPPWQFFDPLEQAQTGDHGSSNGPSRPVRRLHRRRNASVPRLP